MSQSAISEATRKDIRHAAARLAEYREIPPEQFPGHKGVACANLEGWLGRYAIPLLDALEEAERLAESRDMALRLAGR